MRLTTYSGGGVTLFALCSIFIVLISGCPMPEPSPEPELTVPGTMAAPTLEVGNKALIAAWAAPEDDGGSPITGYELQYRTGGGEWTDISGITGAKYTITGLAKATEYHVQARAVNAIGAGGWSESAAATPPATVPDASAAPTLYAGTGRLVTRRLPQPFMRELGGSLRDGLRRKMMAAATLSGMSCSIAQAMEHGWKLLKVSLAQTTALPD